MKKMMLGLALAFGVSAQASVLTLEGEVKKIENVTIAKTVKATIDSKQYTLTTVAAGLRKKRPIRILPAVKVYVVQMAATEPAKFNRHADQALASTEASQAVTVQLTFLRDVEAEKVSVAFRDALTANSVHLKNPEIVAFLKAVDQSGEAKAGKTLTMAMSKNSDGSETVVFENNNGQQTAIKGPKGFSQNVLSMWLGKITEGDDELANTKQQLLAPL